MLVAEVGIRDFPLRKSKPSRIVSGNGCMTILTKRLNTWLAKEKKGRNAIVNRCWKP